MFCLCEYCIASKFIHIHTHVCLKLYIYICDIILLFHIIKNRVRRGDVVVIFGLPSISEEHSTEKKISRFYSFRLQYTNCNSTASSVTKKKCDERKICKKDIFPCCFYILYINFTFKRVRFSIIRTVFLYSSIERKLQFAVPESCFFVEGI